MMVDCVTFMRNRQRVCDDKGGYNSMIVEYMIIDCMIVDCVTLWKEGYILYNWMIVECVTSSRNCRFSAVNSFLQNLSRYPQHKLFPTNACQARNKKQERVMGNG